MSTFRFLIVALLAVAFLAGGGAAAQGPPAFNVPAPETVRSSPLPGRDATPLLGPFGTYRALVVLVRFRDDTTYTPADFRGWPVGAVETPAFAYGLLDPTDDPAAFRDSTLTRYFYDQSRQPSGEALVFYGDVYPEVIETAHDETHYYRYDLDDCTATGCTARPGGFGFLTKEVLDGMDARGFDFSLYDRNDDGELDYLYVLVRHTPAAYARLHSGAWNCAGRDPTRDPHDLCGLVPTHSGVSHLQSGSGEMSDTFWGPGQSAPVLQYDGKRVNWDRGVYAFVRNPIPPSQPGMVHLAAHEVGHDLWGDHFGHAAPIGGNDVPQNPEGGRDAVPYGYVLMDGGGRNKGADGYLVVSARERELLGWLHPRRLTEDRRGLRLPDLYASGLAYEMALPRGRKVLLSNHQEVGYFNRRLRSLCTGCNPDVYINGGLRTSGLLALLAEGSGAMEPLPADGTLRWTSFAVDFQGDLYGPDTKAQLTPWTRPNTSGCMDYAHPYCDVAEERTWQAIDDIRYLPGDPDSTAVFDYYADYRLAPEVAIRADSWMGAETAGTSFLNPVRVYAGATLTIEAGAALTFAGGLRVDEGAVLAVEEGTVLRFGAGEILRADQPLRIAGPVAYAASLRD